MNWNKLSEHKDAFLSRGSLLRFSASYPFEDEVIMMVCDSPLGNHRLGLITISGYKAGFNCYTSFPENVRNKDGSITAGKIYDNWNDWIWPEWSPDDAWILPEGLSTNDLK
jgi:hypothetical protein